MAVHKANPYYGVARFAIELNWTEKKARRIRNLAGITAAKRTKKNRHKPGVAEVTAPMNALKAYADFKNVSRPQDGQKAMPGCQHPKPGYRTLPISGSTECGSMWLQ